MNKNLPTTRGSVRNQKPYICDFDEEIVVLDALVGGHVEAAGARHEVPQAEVAGRLPDAGFGCQDHGHPVGVPSGHEPGHVGRRVVGSVLRLRGQNRLQEEIGTYNRPDGVKMTYRGQLFLFLGTF